MLMEVEGEVQGDDDSVQKLLRDVARGPSMAHVVKVDKTDKEVEEGETSFEVK